jgi:hypothetical protein
VLHFSGGFVRERESQDIFPGEQRVRFEQVTDAFGDYAGFAGPGARNYQERALAVLDGGALLGVQLEAGF